MAHAPTTTTPPTVDSRPPKLIALAITVASLALLSAGCGDKSHKIHKVNIRYELPATRAPDAA